MASSSASTALSEASFMSFITEKALGSIQRDASSSRWASIFGGPNTDIGFRIIPLPDSYLGNDDIAAHLQGESDSSIQYRSCSWPKTAALMLAQYIGLAIMCFPSAFSEMGWVGGIVSTLLNAAFYQYTAFVLWDFCLRHPEVRDICDVGQIIIGNKKWAWWATAVMFVLNNTCVMGLHVVVGSEYLNTATAHWATSICRTVLFGVVIAVMCWFCSLARTFSMLSHLATASALFTFASVIMATVFTATQDHPVNYEPKSYYTAADGSELIRGTGTFSAWPAAHATFTSLMVALLNISYTFIGQISLPSYIAEMKDPRDFPKALWTCILAEVAIFTSVGIVIYKYTGTEYLTSPAFGGLSETHKLVSFSFLLPSIVFIGALYASITARFVFFRLFQGSKHMCSHTVKGWTAWCGILVIIWVLAFIVSQIVPFFSALLALVGAVFDAFFGFIFWGVAWFGMRNADFRNGRRSHSRELDYVHIMINALLILIGFGVFLIAGTIASAYHIENEFTRGQVRSVFSCSSNAL